MRDLTQNDWTNFIKGELKEKLKLDLLAMKMFRESDLQACCYYHLRQFANGRGSWRILNETWIKGLGRRPDLLICKSTKPVLIIELKYRRRYEGPSSKDAEVLTTAVESKEWARKAIFLQVVLHPTKSTGEKLPKSRGRIVTVALTEEEWKSFEPHFRTFRKPSPRRTKGRRFRRED